MYRSRFAIWALLYAGLICYGSTVIGPDGLHYVPLDAGAALRRFLAMRFVANGSDQRADWMGNLSLLVPFGVLLTGSLSRRHARCWPAMCGAFVLSVMLILAVKYAQLFFPPRTVTLNYVAAQALGAAIGIALFGLVRGRVTMAFRPGVDSLTAILRTYLVVLIVFLLMPLDFALSAADLKARIADLPQVMTALPDEGRPLAVRAMLIAAGAAAFIPVGMLFTIIRHGGGMVGRPVGAATLRGFVLVLGVFALSTLLISGAPSLVSVAYRTLGVALGAGLLHALVRQDLVRLRHRLAWLVPLLAIPYAIALLAANRLFSVHWLSPAEAIRGVYPLGLIPLFDYYIVSKAAAAANIAAHLVMYAPIGVMAWLRFRSATAAPIAVALALIIELARYLRPGLEGDINAVAVAGIAAWLSAALMPPVWRMLESVSNRRDTVLPSGVPGWRDRAVGMQAPATLPEIEHP